MLAWIQIKFNESHNVGHM